MARRTWTSSDPRWLALNPFQRAAAMALMEADGMNPQAARNALAAMINRSAKSGADLGEHVSQAIYQPAIEPTQQARLDRILGSQAFHDLTGWAERRAAGREPDPVQGATHFLAPESVMLDLEAREPSKYRSWRDWTGFDPETKSYRGVVMRDSSHAFLVPEGPFSAKGSPGASPAAPAAPAVASAATPDADVGTAGLLASLFGDQQQKPAFSSLMSELGRSSVPDAPKLNTPNAPVVPIRPVDPAQLLAIVRRRSRLGTS